jgi:2-dehydropantoate 2-reductase
MRTLVVGAGGTGGYFGGRLLEAGRDVTFLVRERRAALLAENGLVIRSGVGDVHIPHPPVVTADRLDRPFDLILLSCKAYDLESAMKGFAPAIGPASAILPVLNGMGHLAALDARFGPEHVLGGRCLISSTLDGEGRILHLNEAHMLSYGERDGSRSGRILAIDAALSNAGFTARLTDRILAEMWEKWTRIASIAGITCLMRGSIGDVVAAGGSDLGLQLQDECTAIAAAHGYPLDEVALAQGRAMLTEVGSTMTASMFRDMEQGGAIEAEQILGDLTRAADAVGLAVPLLRTAYIHLKTYEARRAGRAG